MYSEQLYTLLM